MSKQLYLKSICGLTLLASACAVAAPSGYLPGASLTTGAISNPYALSSLAYNPASAGTALREGEHVRFGWLSSFGTAFELGDVANFEDEINQLSDDLDRTDLTLSEAQTIVDRFNAVLPAIGTDGYLKSTFGGTLPFLPVVFSVDAVPGHFFVDSSLELLIGGHFIDAPVTVQSAGTTGTVVTESSLYLKSGQSMRLGFGYAQPVWQGGKEWMAGDLIVGGRLDYHRVSLSKQVIQINDVDDFGDTVEDDYDNNEVTTGGVSLSLGAIWKADMFQLGLTLNNANEPEFEYGSVGQNCGSLIGASQTNCFQAQSFAADGRIDATETHTMRAYMSADASFWATPNWMIGSSLDLGEHEDFVGDDYQWLTVAALYQGSHWALPGARVGYRSNLVGTELSSLTFGFTLFRNANLDIEYGLDTTTVDGSSAPRNFAFNFGFEEHF